MQINPVNALIAVLLSALIAYALWSFDGTLANHVAVGAFVFLVATLVPLIGGSYERPRNGFNLRVTSGVFCVIALLDNILFASFDFSATAYIVTTASLFLVYVLLANAVYNARQ